MAIAGLALTIVIINIAYVSLFTLRMIMVIKGQKFLASVLSVFEVFIYLMGLNIVLNSLDQPLNIAAYCIGWGTGVYVGSKIEERLALGYSSVQVIVDSLEIELPGQLRALGYGVTSWPADGKDAKRLVMQVLVKRSNEKRLMKQLSELSPKAFIVSYEPKFFKGGFWVRRLR